MTWPARAADASKAAAKAHYEAATRLYEIREFEAALKEYKAGYLVRPDPSFLYNIGQCYKKLGRPEQAREFFREYLKKAEMDESKRAQAEARLRELDTADEGKLVPPPATTGTGASVQSGAARGKADDGSATPGTTGLPFAAAPAYAPGNQPPGVDLSSGAAGSGEVTPTPYYQTWWFWTGVGAVVAAGVVTALVWPRGDNQLTVSGTTLGTRTVLQ